MTNYKLYGIASALENVEFEMTNVDPILNIAEMAEKEVMQQHPEYESVNWYKIDAD